MLDTIAARSMIATTVGIEDAVAGSGLLLAVSALRRNTNATQSGEGSTPAGVASGCDITSVVVDVARLIASASAGVVLHAGVLPPGETGAVKPEVVMETRGEFAWGTN